MTAVKKKKQAKLSGTWLITLPLLALTLGYIYFVFIPINAAIARARKELSDKEFALAESNLMPSKIHATATQVEAAQKYVEAQEARKTPRAELSSLFGKISHLAQQAGVETIRFEPDSAKKFETFQQVPLRLGCRGTFAEIYSLVHSLEELPELIWVNDLKIEQMGESGGDIACEIELVVFSNKLDSSD